MFTNQLRVSRIRFEGHNPAAGPDQPTRDQGMHSDVRPHIEKASVRFQISCKRILDFGLRISLQVSLLSVRVYLKP